MSTLTLRWDTMLNITKVEFELIQDPGICLYFLKKVWEVEFLVFQIDIVKPTISI